PCHQAGCRGAASGNGNTACVALERDLLRDQEQLCQASATNGLQLALDAVAHLRGWLIATCLCTASRQCLGHDGGKLLLDALARRLEAKETCRPVALLEQAKHGNHDERRQHDHLALARDATSYGSWRRDVCPLVTDGGGGRLC